MTDLERAYAFLLKEFEELRERLAAAEEALRHADREAGLDAIDPTTRTASGWGDPPVKVMKQFAPNNFLPTTWQRAVEAARGEWELGVAEPPGENCARINEYIRGAQGLNWLSASIKPDGPREYVRNGQFAWCGAFAAFCLGAAGLPLDVRKRHLASCYRIREFARSGGADFVEFKDVLPGDVLVVGRADGKGKAWGDHVTLVREPGVNGGEIATYEGNSVGPGPRGTHEGVIKRTRPLEGHGRTYVAKYAVRFRR